MVKRTGGFRRKTRNKLQTRPRDRGKIKLKRLLQEFQPGERVRIMQEPSSHRGMPHPHFKNLTGTVIRRQGNCYVISIMDGNKEKTLISTAVHLERMQ